MATRGQRKQLSKAELTRLEKEAEKRSEARQAANKERSKAEIERRTQSNSRLSKKELTAKEKAAEKRTAQRQEANKEKSRAEFNKRKSASTPKPGTRRAKVQARRVAEKNIPKPVRDLMISEKQDKQNKGDSKLRTTNKRTVSKSTADQVIKTATDKGKDTLSKVGSRVGSLSKAVAGLGALLYSSEVGKGSDVVPAGRENEFVKKMDAERKAKTRGRGDGASEVKQRKTDAAAKSEPKSTQSDAPAGPPRTIAEAKKRGLDYFVGKDGKRKAAVTKEELDASGLSLRDYLNKKQGKTRKMAKGGYANCGASMKPTQKSSQGVK